MTDQEKERAATKEFFEINLKGRKFSIYDLLGVRNDELKSLLLTLVQYNSSKPEGERLIQSLNFFLHPNKARVIAHQIINKQIPSDGYFWDKGKDGKLRRFIFKAQEVTRGSNKGPGYYLYIGEGRSKKCNGIEILDQSQEIKKEEFYFTEFEGLEMALAIQDRIRAWEILRVYYARGLDPYALDLSCDQNSWSKSVKEEKKQQEEKKEVPKSQKYSCKQCGYEVDEKVAKFCQKSPFNGTIYCVKCQKKIAISLLSSKEK